MLQARGGDCCGDCVHNGFVAAVGGAASVPVGVGVDDVFFAGGGSVDEFDCDLVACHGGVSLGGVCGGGVPAAGVATVGKGRRRGKLGGLDVDGGCHHCAVASFARGAVSLPDFNV